LGGVFASFPICDNTFLFSLHLSLFSSPFFYISSLLRAGQMGEGGQETMPEEEEDYWGRASPWFWFLPCCFPSMPFLVLLIASIVFL
jgi:hypothetical protein